MTLNNIFDAQEIGHTFDNARTAREIDEYDHFVEVNNMVDDNGDTQELNFDEISKVTEQELYFQQR